MHMRTIHLTLFWIILNLSALAQPTALPPNLAFLPNGTYEMGCTSGQTPCSANNQAHLVEIDSFYLSTYEITQAQYEAVMGANPSINSGCPECPVENVSWYDALNFCNQLSLQNSLEPCYYADPQLSQPFSGSTGLVYWHTEADGFRLPTEAEWEYAARSAGAEDFAYAGSNNFNDMAWLAAGSTQAAGQLLPNSIGLYDMSGNASEWVWDYIADFTNSLACQPLGPGTGSERVRRGGSFQSASTFKLATRESAPPGSNSGHTGFRVASNNDNLPPASLSCVANLVEPVDGASDVAAQTSISWEAVAEAEGYFLSLGTSPGGTDLLNEEDVGSITSYSLASCLPGNTDIYVTVNPYNSLGTASGCGSFTFRTGTGTPDVPSMPNGTAQVCAGDTESYSILPVNGADNYVWAILSGGNLVSGQGTTTAIVSWTGPGGQICVLAENECGTSDLSCSSIAGENILPAPDMPFGSNLICVGDTESYSTSTVSGADSYNWSVTGGSITAGQGSTDITVNWASAGGQVCVNAQNQCGASSDVCTSISGVAIPSDPGAPAGNTTVCSGDTEAYSINPVSGANSYTWSVTGGSITAGQGSTDITVNWTTAGGQVCVNAQNQCGTSTDVCTAINGVTIPTAPGSPAGNTTVCSGDTEAYSINPVSGANSYNWSVTGGSITAGQGSTDISVNWTTAGGQVCVNAQNQCGESSDVCTSINGVTIPTAPGAPAGNTTVCSGDTEAYSINPVSGANSYNWSVTGGSITAGQGSTDITVNWATAGGQVCVNAQNQCGESTDVCTSISGVTIPSDPGAPAGNTIVCSGDTEAYSINPVSGANSYNWSVTGGNITAGQGSTSITVDWTSQGGQVCVNAQNQCGSSSDACTSIGGESVPATPDTPAGPSPVCAGDTESYSTNPVGNADTYNWSVTGGNITAGQGSTSIAVNWTSEGGQVCVNAQNQCGSSSDACTSVGGESVPATPDTPSGPSPVSAGDFSDYTTNGVAGADSYTWTVTGGNIISGQNSTSVLVEWTSAGGEVCVAAANACGSSPLSCLTVDGSTSGEPPSMVSVPGGTFDMGCTAEQTQSVCSANESPVHSVTLSPYLISATEVTQAQWAAMVPEYTPDYSQTGQGDTHPAHYISWFDAVTYCNRLSQSQGFTPAYYADPGYTQVYDALDDGNGPVYWDQSANGYRLPTEAEWEYAARGAGAVPQTEFSGSNDIDAVAWWNGNNGGQSQPVGTKNPNALNTFDMSGNVWEWCWDRYDADYYSNSPANNPTGPTSGSNRVRRGGSWGYTATYCRVAYRSGLSPGNRFGDFGFRLSRTP